MFKEYNQMEDMEVLSGVNPDSLAAEQKRKVLRQVNLIKLKISNKTKGRMCANGEPNHCYITEKPLRYNSCDSVVVFQYYKKST